MDIKAVNPANGTPLWVNPKAQPAVEISAGFLANDVYFVGSLDGQVRAYNALNGDKLWTSQAHGSVGSSIWADGNMVLWGAGVPKRFGGKTGQNGVFAYQVGAQQTAQAPQNAAAEPTAPAASQLYAEWAGEDAQLTVDEWDAAVDQAFGEENADLAVVRWDADSDGIISEEEFGQAAAEDDLFDTILR